MSSGQKVPDEIVDDLLAEAMVAKVDKSKVRWPSTKYPRKLTQREGARINRSAV